MGLGEEHYPVPAAGSPGPGPRLPPARGQRTLRSASLRSTSASRAQRQWLRFTLTRFLLSAATSAPSAAACVLAGVRAAWRFLRAHLRRGVWRVAGVFRAPAVKPPLSTGNRNSLSGEPGGGTPA
ncbi:hypothetical protein AAFF_G00041860 [Aldrovandia affinis]|uniref:Uncharacterized protein n=1 Tax=Aldrovandia affinis TaxID=143900 RepID=A0AAD7S2P0_9TELE|nr:hypothetical protein AAFF_G00041860 [Aldrovandia affinis]